MFQIVGKPIDARGTSAQLIPKPEGDPAVRTACNTHALVVARAANVGDDQHGVRLRHHATQHTIARRIVVVQAWRVEEPHAAGAKERRCADRELLKRRTSYEPQPDRVGRA